MEEVEELLKHKNDYWDFAGSKIYEPYSMQYKDWEEIQNLINKYRELEKERDGIYADYQDLGKEKLKLEEKCEEQEKMIFLMANYIVGTDKDEDVCKKVGQIDLIEARNRMLELEEAEDDK